MNEWIEELSDVTASGEPAVLVTVAGIRGSAPREIGAKMVVTPAATYGTIGGGQLEYQCTRLACEMFDGDASPALRKFPLGISMGQCCGGVVDILFEPVVDTLPGWLRDLRALHGQREPAVIVTHLHAESPKALVTAADSFGAALAPEIVEIARRSLDVSRTTHRVDDWFFEIVSGTGFDIAVFGAGHVGSAVVASLSRLDCNIRWIDNRRNIFRQLPANVRAVEASEPALEVAAMPPKGYYLVMTHSHALDFEICGRILRRGDAAYCGLIGSVTKRRRFEKRFRSEGLTAGQITQLTCPIGVEGIGGKKPAEIAVATAAEVLQARERAAREAMPARPDNIRAIRRGQ